MDPCNRNHPAAFVLTHNHPFGLRRPSESDLAPTVGLMAAGGQIRIPGVNPVIIGSRDHSGLADHGLIEKCRRGGATDSLAGRDRPEGREHL